MVWVIYTADHIIDGYKYKGQSGIFRYDFNCKFRKILIPVCAIILAGSLWLIHKNQDALFVNNGVWLIPVIPIYFFLKINGKLKPLVKMLIVSIVVSAVIVSLYKSESFLADFLSYERFIMLLLVLLNQLVLEHFEFHEENKTEQPTSKDLYSNMAKRVFIWVTLVLVFLTYLNPDSWPFTVSLFITALLLRAILHYQNWFEKNRLYRYWADFSFVLLWPLLMFFNFIASYLFY